MDVLIDEHENVEMPSQSNVQSIVACVEVGGSRIFESTLYLEICWLRLNILNTKYKITATNHDTMLSLRCDLSPQLTMLYVGVTIT